MRPSSVTVRVLLAIVAACLVAAAILPARARQPGLSPGPAPYRLTIPGIAADGPAPPLAVQCATAPRALPIAWAPGDRYAQWVQLGRDRYVSEGIDYHYQLAHYRPGGDYLNWGTLRNYGQDPSIRFDANGIPTVNINGDGVFYFHPTTTAQYALVLYGRWLNGEGDLDAFLHVADFLLTMQDGRGAFPLNFPYVYYITGETLPAGWVSALTQGQGMSVFARAYGVTGDERYREAGDRALAFMLTPASEGGTRSTLAGLHPDLGTYAFFNEYPASPPAYTLNGFMYTMLGLYDWWQLEPGQAEGTSAEAGAWFNCSMASLRLILPLYDIGGFSAYDLGYLVYGAAPNPQAWYHGAHIGLLHALASFSGDEVLAPTEMRWRGYVDGLPRSQTGKLPGPWIGLPHWPGLPPRDGALTPP